jgi:hypothetical protein
MQIALMVGIDFLELEMYQELALQEELVMTQAFQQPQAVC